LPLENPCFERSKLTFCFVPDMFSATTPPGPGSVEDTRAHRGGLRSTECSRLPAKQGKPRGLPPRGADPASNFFAQLLCHKVGHSRVLMNRRLNNRRSTTEVGPAGLSLTSGPLVLGEGCQLPDDFLKPCAPLFVGTGGHGSGSLLGRVTAIQVAQVGDLTSQGHNVS
jgi:hypothetical protein